MDNLTGSTNGYEWAREFCTRFKGQRISDEIYVAAGNEVDVTLMATWFANCIEVGRDAGSSSSLLMKQPHPLVAVPKEDVDIPLYDPVPDWHGEDIYVDAEATALRGILFGVGLALLLLAIIYGGLALLGLVPWVG